MPQLRTASLSFIGALASVASLGCNGVDTTATYTLELEVIAAPRNGTLTPTRDGLSFTPSTAEAMTGRATVRITSGACAYVAQAEFVTGA